MTEMVGKMLGQYEITEEIAKGGMSTVFKARQKSMGRDVAIKILPAALLHDEKFMQRFTREVEVIAKLQHPHILPVYDFGEQDGVPYIVMAYLGGGTLTEYIRSRGPLEPAETIRLLTQIASALEHAHNKGIIHRDFKPSNVLLDDQGNTYLSDFGVAKLVEGEGHITGTAILGTPHYMAPEQAGGEQLTPAADVYALGATVFQMLTGRLPYDAPTPMGVIIAHATLPVPEIRPLRMDLPTQTQDVINKAMAKTVLDRYPTPTSLAQALAQVLQVGQSTPTHSAPMPTPKPINALAMTNMLGNVIFVDQECLQLLRRPLQDARTIIGKPLSEAFGIPADVQKQLVEDVNKKGRVEGLELDLHDMRNEIVSVTCTAIATYDAQRSFVGMDLTLKPNKAAAERIENTGWSVGEERLDTQEGSYLQYYFRAQVKGLQELLLQVGGRKLRDHLDTVLNETAQRNVWPVTIDADTVRIELDNKDTDIYRALLAKATNYAISVIGQGIVTKQMNAIDEKLDPRIRRFVSEMGLRVAG